MSGYELKKVFTTTAGYGWRAYDTQIYRELKALEQSGLVKGEVQPGRGGPQRRVYEPTCQGVQVLRDWFESPLDETSRKSELTTRIWSLDLFPAGALDQLVSTVRLQTQEQLEHMGARREELRRTYGPPEVASDPTVVGRLLVLEYEIDMAHLKLRWLERVEAVTGLRAMLEDSATEPDPRMRVGHRRGKRPRA
jgi:DNA-binding PadR family transcriptional regulator